MINRGIPEESFHSISVVFCEGIQNDGIDLFFELCFGAANVILFWTQLMEITSEWPGKSIVHQSLIFLQFSGKFDLHQIEFRRRFLSFPAFN
jgi:hypothetical protein